MDNQRLLIWAVFLMLAWVTWQQWIADYGPEPVEQPQAGDTVELEPVEDDLPALSDSDFDAIDLGFGYNF